MGIQNVINNMLKYWDCKIDNHVIPDEVSLCIEITGCPFRCKGCPTKYLWENEGKSLSNSILEILIGLHKTISAVCFMGGDINPYEINELAAHVRKTFPNLKIGWYSGEETISVFTEYKNFDFIKLGPFKKKRGGLDSITTNQRFYKVEPNGLLRNMTHQFWIRKN